MQGVLDRLLAELHSAWRYRWHAVAVAWTACMLGWLAVFLTPDTYEARAGFYLDATSALQPFVKDLTVGMDVDQQVDLIRRVVLGREALQEIARRTDLDLGAKSPEEMEALLERLRAEIQLTGGMPSRADPRVRDRNFEITYRDTDRNRAVQVVRIVLDNFIEKILKRRSSGFQTAREFLQQQISQQEQRLAEAERKLAEFKRRNVGSLPTQEGSYVQGLQAEMNALQDLYSQQHVLESRRQQLSTQLAAERQFVPSGSVPVTSGASSGMGGNDLDRRIQEAQTRLEQLLLVYTPKHPEVIALEENLSQLRAKRREELESMGVKNIPEGSSLAANPAYEQIRLQRNQVDVELAALRGQIADRAERVRRMQSRMETMPQVEAELAQLTRDYDVLKERYTALLQQLETAKLSDVVGDTDRVDFSILDPPTALASPVAPPRLLLVVGVLFLGLGAGAAVAVGLARLNPVFDSVRNLQAVTGLPVIGVVSATWLDRRHARRRTEVLRVAAAGAGLMFMFLVVLVTRDLGHGLLHALTG